MAGHPPTESYERASSLSESLAPFDFAPQTRVVFGPGTVDRLGELARELNASCVFLVTDKGLTAAGHDQQGVDSLVQAGLHVTVFDDVRPNPTTDDVDRALIAARASAVDLIVGLGGGSSMDCAKGVNFILTNGGRMQDYQGIGKATKPMLPMIAVPTTSGTGSEAQSFALIADAETKMKMACGDKKAACRVAILDPELTMSMPASVTTATGIDAISHALETYVTKPRNAMSEVFSRKAWQLLAAGFPRIVRDPGDAEARAAMLLGSHFAGAAIENSMLGATHALANPLSAHYGITHGTAIGVMLPHVIRYNGKSVGSSYGRLAADAGLCASDDPTATDRLATFVESMTAAAGAPTNLRQLNVDPATIPVMAEEAAQQWTGTFNPRTVNPTSLKELYECAISSDRSQSVA